MWKLHRPHHVVEEMGVLVTYRNAFMYYAFMPGLWFSAGSYFLRNDRGLFVLLTY